MNNNKKIFLAISIGLVSMMLLIGVTYALTYTKSSTNQELVMGDIWMRYSETNGLIIENAVPGNDYTNYFEFTISGKNTYTKKSIYYDFVLNRGDTPNGKSEDNRIPDGYLKFKLVSVDSNDQETILFKDKMYGDIENKRIYVEKIENTDDEVDRKYRLYMTIDNSLLIGNTSDAAFTFSEWESAFASVKVNVTGDFLEKEIPLTTSETIIKSAIAKEETDSACKTIIEEDGVTYISGSKECIDFNYVWYSGKLWRITAINADGSMKLVTDDVITIISLEGDYSTSSMRQWLNQEFLPTLYNYQNILNTKAGWYAVVDSNSPPEKPDANYTVTDPVGLLDSYEYYMSYKNSEYELGYLNIGYQWWLLTSYDASTYSKRRVDTDGSDIPEYYMDFSTSVSGGVRPSINLKSTTELYGGEGTKENPYKIKGDIEETTANVTLLNTRISGEYVKLDGDTSSRLFRIVDTEKIKDDETSENKLTTKIVLNDYVKEEGTTLNKTLATSPAFSPLWSEIDSTDTSNWRGYLNITWLQTLNINMLEKGIYYLGHTSSETYKKTVCSIINSELSVKSCIEKGEVETNTSDYVGLLRTGEMFASQLGERTDTTTTMWLISPVGVYVTRVQSRGIFGSSDELLGSYPDKNEYAVRPTINLTNTVVIKSGSGTKNDPFVVGLLS